MLPRTMHRAPKTARLTTRVISLAPCDIEISIGPQHSRTLPGKRLPGFVPSGLYFLLTTNASVPELATLYIPPALQWPAEQHDTEVI